MIRLRHTLLLLLLLIPFAVHAQDATEVEQAQDIIQMLDAGQYAEVYALLDSSVQNVLSQEQLQGAWEQIIAGVGVYESIANVDSDPANHRVTLTLQFKNLQLNALIAFDAEGEVVGLQFVPVSTAPTLAAPTPIYAEPEAFTETDVTVGEFDLPGILTMPVGDGDFPAVVLISGSGPNDRDETIGPNKPFRDLAWGLAAQGIATLRFDKRTLAAVDQLDLNNFTLKDEYTDDALAAVDLLRDTDGVDPERVFILGHSLGGYVAPRIAQADADIAGVIIAAGLALPLPETVLRQTRYLATLNPNSPQAQDAIPAVEALVEQINALTPDSPSDEMLLAAPPAYWLDVQGYDPAALAAALPQPLLLLQGGRDYQVTEADDLAHWQAGLADHADTTFKVYPDLNHLFVMGEGMSTPAEYNQPGNVAQDVIDDIAAWVKAH